MLAFIAMLHRSHRALKVDLCGLSMPTFVFVPMQSFV